ncbi:transporter substrate-binding domain-containing protein [Desulfobacterales bacterium HSG2]|nr:transporter substrate-binding domain-containing protein [Desulfobacterales bacterium HSG2]
MRKNISQLAMAMVLFFGFAPFAVLADEYKATLAQMPVYVISETEGVIVDLVKAIERMTENQIAIGVYPFARSMLNVIKKRADFHIPLIKNDIIPEEKLPYYYSAETIFHVNFVLYTVKESGVTLNNISQYKVETDRAHVDYFPFEMIPSSKIIQSLKKLHVGRIDAFVFSDVATDPILRKLGYTEIQRIPYKRFEVKIILPKTEHGKQVDRMLSDAIQELRKSGKLKEILGTVDQPYDNWQP